MAWTSEQDFELKTLLSQGKSMSQCADALNEKFGTLYTRNSAIGRSNRKGFKSLNKSNSRTGTRPHRATTIRVRRALSPPMVPAMPILSLPEIEPTPETIVTFEQLLNHHCRWPIGEHPSLFYCGNVALEKLPYCAFHIRKAHVAPEDRRRRRAVA